MLDRVRAFLVRRRADRLAWAEYYGHRFGMARLNDAGTATEREARTRGVWPGDPDEARAFARGLRRAIEDWGADRARRVAAGAEPIRQRDERMAL
jgi:hypothetical protein